MFCLQILNSRVRVIGGRNGTQGITIMGDAVTIARPEFLTRRSNRTASTFDELRNKGRNIVIELTHDSETTSDPISPKDWAPKTAEGESSIPVLEV